MSEKRFLGAYGKTNKILEKGKCDYDLEYAEDVQKVVDLLNSLNDENEQLRQTIKKMKSDEAIRKAYANLNKKEREKHSQGNATYTRKSDLEVMY